MQKRLFDIGWSDESKCQACHKEEGEVRREIPEDFRKWVEKSENLKEGVEVTTTQ